MMIEEQLEKLAGIVSTLAGSAIARDRNVEAHDRQIEALIIVAEKNSGQIKEQNGRFAVLERQWQAYINTLPRH
jgi:hypothetical protein